MYMFIHVYVPLQYASARCEDVKSFVDDLSLGQGVVLSRAASTLRSIETQPFDRSIFLEAMGFPTSMFTPIFAVSRTVGWISQWKEQFEDPQQKIGRPRQLYLGETERNYVDVEKRG